MSTTFSNLDFRITALKTPAKERPDYALLPLLQPACQAEKA